MTMTPQEMDALDASLIDASLYFDRQDQPCTQERWMELWTDLTSRAVGRTRVGDVVVSTVWLGLNHAAGLPGLPPLLYETMVFDARVHDEDGEEPDYGTPLETMRYSTGPDAIAGHERTVDEWRQRLGNIERADEWLARITPQE